MSSFHVWIGAGVELVPTAHTTLQFGDVLHMVGKTDILNQAISVIGNAKQKLLQVQMLPVFIGIGLGVLLGSIPFIFQASLWH